MFKYISVIIKAVGDKPMRLVTLLVIGILGITATYVYYKSSSSSCTNLISENQRLMKSQSDLVDQNTKLIQKSSEAINAIFEMKTAIDLAKTDNVDKVIEKTNKTTHKKESSVTASVEAEPAALLAYKDSGMLGAGYSVARESYHSTKKVNDTVHKVTIIKKKNIALEKASTKIDSIYLKFKKS